MYTYASKYACLCLSLIIMSGKLLTMKQLAQHSVLVNYIDRSWIRLPHQMGHIKVTISIKVQS